MLHKQGIIHFHACSIVICNHHETIIHFICFFVRCTGEGREEKRWYSQLKTVRPKTQGASVLSDQKRLGGLWICKTIIMSCI
jgi:hypothetical protein